VEPTQEALERAAQQRDRAFDLAAREQEARDRSHVTATVMAVFLVTLLVSLGALLVGGLVGGGWATIAPHVVDILKSVVLPVVTLVLGYYFGRGGRG
jgi:hypothetical protein